MKILYDMAGKHQIDMDIVKDIDKTLDPEAEPRELPRKRQSTGTEH
jgi:hypothetical protein